jgi:hypothetical protein
MRTFDVYFFGRLIDRVSYPSTMTADDVRAAEIDSGAPYAIVVRPC